MPFGRGLIARMNFGFAPVRSCWKKDSISAQAGNRHVWMLSPLRAHPRAPYKTDLLRRML